ncbi:alpha/beta hydrolase [Tateyamaria omphalii]|uniref:alpha/beta fold hydrolase n=1 Tax=Tateyamaria omphalii TaxID=299262 RepID=UPI001C99DCE2|nr:alpha/beta hydrolase [Tateyamaria omphalii]MBY5935255.1 alpha/beta hydrolase [Tateyamaria omphalii]
MKRLFAGLALALILCAVIVAAAWVLVPTRVAAVLLHLNSASAGLSAGTVSTDVGDIHYLEGGAGETVVLIHGIYARKEHWVELARSLVDAYHVVAIDLPGFGDNARLSDDAYLLDRQAENLRAVLQALEVEKAHIGANSMGAYVSALLAEAHPDLVSSIAFVGSPLGVPTPVQSDMDVARAGGDTPLVVQSEADFVARNDWLSPQIPYVPGPILTMWMQDEVATGDHNARIWDVVHHQSDVPTVLELAPSLTMPSLVIWCAPDRIFHVSGAAMLHRALPASTLVTLDGCGHVPMLDRPRTVAEVYQAFLRDVGGDAAE